LFEFSSIANFGVGGNTTSDILDRLPHAIEQVPRLIVIMAGTNDAQREIPNNVTLRNLHRMEFELEGAKITFVILTPPPCEVSVAAAGTEGTPMAFADPCLKSLWCISDEIAAVDARSYDSPNTSAAFYQKMSRRFKVQKIFVQIAQSGSNVQSMVQEM
jgi:hypothetical protein